MSSAKIILASQARSLNQYQNLRSKIWELCVNIYFNYQYLKKNPTRNYAKINIPHTSPATVDKQQKIQNLSLRDEIKFLYMKKEKLNNTLHKVHLKLPKNGEKHDAPSKTP